MRTNKPKPFDPNKEYKIGERSIYRGMVIVAEKWITPSAELIAKIGYHFPLVCCAVCCIKNEDCKVTGLNCFRTSRSDKKRIYYRKIYELKTKSDE